MAPIIQFASNLITQLIIVRAYCKLFNMRSNVVFGMLSIGGMIVAIGVDALFSVPLFRTAFMGPVVFFVLPLACSRGPLRQRVLRCALILTAMMVSVMPSALVLAVCFGPSAVELTGYGSETTALLSLVLSTTSSGFCIEVLLALMARWEKRQDVTLMPPIVLLLLWSYLISVFCFTLAGNQSYSVDPKLSVASSAYYVLVLALCAVSALLFRGDVQTAWRESQRTLTDEQSKLVRAEIDVATKRAAVTRRLHHVLANEASTICELVEQGDTRSARTYLNALREQAHRAISSSDDSDNSGDSGDELDGRKTA